MTTKPMNISRENVQGKCDLKCAYNFKYSESNITAKNDNVMISLTYDKSSVPPVMYNNEKYNVSKIMIVKPSLHYFNNSAAAGEFIIEHVPVKGGPLLSVAIPITSSSESSVASTSVTSIIQQVATNAPSSQSSTNVKIANFNLQNIVPSKPFFSYTNSNNTSGGEWIVFGIVDAIPLSSAILKTLGQIIKPFPIPMSGNNLFFNSSGPNTVGGSLGDGIYISCKPTGSSEEEVPVEYAKDTPSYDLENILENPSTRLLFQIIIGCIIFVMLFAVISYAYAFISKTGNKSTSSKLIG